MPAVTINYWAVLVAAIINMVIGAVWYSKVLFAKPWAKSIGKKVEDMSMAGPAMGLALIGALIMAYVLAHVVNYTSAVTAMDGARTGFWMWAGFVLPVVTGISVFESRSRDWFLISVGYYLIVLVINGALLAHLAI